MDTFLKNPPKKIQRTEVINFGIIREEIKGTPKEKVEKLRQSAETVLVDDFKNYSTESEVKAFEVVLKVNKKKNNRMRLSNETKNYMKEFLVEHKSSNYCYYFM